MENNEAKKPQVLYMILTGRKLSEIATALDVSVRSIQRWLDEPDFADAVREEHQAARRIAIAQARTEMSSDLEEGQLSRTLLSQIRNDEKAPIHARIRCAALLIGRADRWTHGLDKDVAKETNRGMGVPPMSAAVVKGEPSQKAPPVRQIDTHGPEAHATQKPRQKATENDTLNRGMGVSPMSTASAEGEPPQESQPVRQIDTHGPEAHATVKKPRQKATDHDTTPCADVPKASIPSHSVLCDSAPLREPPVFEPVQAIADSAEAIVASLTASEAAGTRQNTTKDDTLPGDPPSPALQNLAFSPLLLQTREQVLANLKMELEKLDQLEKDVTERARARNIGNTSAMREFNEQIASARTKLIEAIVAIEEASPQDFANAFGRSEAARAS